MIVIVEDDKNIRELVLYTLRNAGFEAHGYANGDDFYHSINFNDLELLLLDIMLPKESGLDILTKLRNNPNTKDLPIIMLTAKDSEYDKIIGLDSGADDYVTKPFSMLELVSRVKALLRRVTTKKLLSYKSLSINDERHIVYLDGKHIDITLKEYEILKLLLSNPNKVITRNVLLNTIWGYEFVGETRTLDVHIRTLRTKLGIYDKYIETVRGIGYRLGGNDD